MFERAIMPTPRVEIVLSPIGPQDIEDARGPFNVLAILMLPDGSSKVEK